MRITTAVLISSVFVFNAGSQCRSQFKRPIAADLEKTYAFIKTLPKDALFAAHPLDADGIPLRAMRSVVASKEISLPYYLGYYRRVAERTTSELTACYASDWADVDVLRAKYDADFFLVNRSRFREKRVSYFRPFRDAAQAQLERGQKDGFVLDQPPAHRVVFASGDYMIVKLSDN